MFGPPGYAYVYRSYGIHWCLNFVCEPEGSASAVLIRALEPLEGLAKMRRRRRARPTSGCCAPGPDGCAQALGVTARAQRAAARPPPFELYAREATPEIAAGVRIGITKAAELPWRYGLEGSRFLSKPFKAD